jgi:hypothetical protein
VCRDTQVTVFVFWERFECVFVLVFAFVLFYRLYAHFVRVYCVFQAAHLNLLMCTGVYNRRQQTGHIDCVL